MFVVKRPRPPGAPTSVDLHRLRRARREARTAIDEAEARYEGERLAAFRRELRSSVRCVSPFLLSLLLEEDLELDDVVARIAPTLGWPQRPRLSRVFPGSGAAPHPLRHARAAAAVGLPQWEPEMLHEHGLRLKCGGWARVQVVAHALEVKAKVEGAVFETRFGELRVTVKGAMPLALAAAAVGRPLDGLLAHSATSRRGWLVSRVDNSGSTSTVVAATGAVPLLLKRFP